MAMTDTRQQIQESEHRLAVESMRDWQSDVLDDLDDAMKGVRQMKKWAKRGGSTIDLAACERYEATLRALIGDVLRLQVR